MSIELPECSPNGMQCSNLISKIHALHEENQTLKDYLYKVSRAVGNTDEWDQAVPMVEALVAERDALLKQRPSEPSLEDISVAIGEEIGWRISVGRNYAESEGIRVSPVPYFLGAVYSGYVRKAIEQAGLEMMELSEIQNGERIYQCYLRSIESEGWEFNADGSDPYEARGKALYKFLTA